MLTWSTRRLFGTRRLIEKTRYIYLRLIFTKNGDGVVIGSLSTDVFETWTATGRRMQLLLARSDLNRSVEKP